MCGVIGIYGKNAPAYFDRLKQTLPQMKHRGPDAANTYLNLDNLCALGHVRLAIVDLTSGANQPFLKNSTSLVYNGEIYNHQKLRHSLKGHFSTSSDTETLTQGLYEQGLGFLSKLEGMFAGAYHDESKQSLALFRDTLGIKNIYYYIQDETFFFCSELSTLLALLGEKFSAEKEVLYTYLSFENYPQSKTLFKNIHHLLPGELLNLSITNNELVIQSSFYQRETEKKFHTPSDYITEGKEIIINAVESHLMSDVPLGVYLSGGIDSSLVASIAASKIKGLKGFTGYFENQDGHYDERHYSRIVAEKSHIELKEVPITHLDFKTSFDEVIRHLGTPKMGMGAFSQYIVAREAAKERKVILAGHGGDELFAGYPMHKAFWAMNEGKTIEQLLKSVKAKNLKEAIWILYPQLMKMKSGNLYFAPKLTSRYPQTSFIKSFVQQPTKPLDQLNEYYLETYIPGLLNVEDHISMAHSLETRVPLWSNSVVDWAMKIPIQNKMINGKPKGLLKEIAKGIIPNELLSAPKRGFPTPLKEWFRNELFEDVSTRISGENIFLDQFSTQKDRSKLVNSHRCFKLPFALDEKRAHHIWMLLCLESWSRQFGVQDVN